MGRGKWYLAFWWYDAFGKSDRYENIPLSATTEDGAVVEAKTKAESGEKVKTSVGHMPVPQRYSVIYKIPIEEGNKNG